MKGSRVNSYYFKPHLSILNQDRYLFPGNNLTFKLERSDPAFCLSAEGANPGGGAKIKLVSCKLYARQLNVNPSIQEAHNQTLLNFVPGKFFTDKVSTTLFTIPPGTVTIDRNIQFSGQLPKYAFVGFVKHAAAGGQFNLNPFNFSNHNVKSVTLSVDGVPVSEPYEPDFANGKYTREYVHFLMTGREGAMFGHTITPEEYNKGRTLYGFDMRGDLDEGIQLVKNGSMSLKASFTTATAITLALIVYTVRDESFLVDFERRVTIAGDNVV